MTTLPDLPPRSFPDLAKAEFAQLRAEIEDLRVRVKALEYAMALQAGINSGYEKRLAALEANVSLLQKALPLLRDGLKVNAETIQAGFAEYAARLAALEAWKREQEGDGK